MLLTMSTCHECLLVDKSTTGGSEEYHGSSPDEIALVDSASRCGFKFIENAYNVIRLQLMGGHTARFRVEDLFEFDSDRKRMSIVLSAEDMPGYKLLFCKGADSVIDSLLRKEYKQEKTPQYECYEKIKEGITQNSRTGLRTLLFGYKPIPESEYRMLKQKIIENSDQHSSVGKESAIMAL